MAKVQAEPKEKESVESQDSVALDNLGKEDDELDEEEESEDDGENLKVELWLGVMAMSG